MKNHRKEGLISSKNMVKLRGILSLSLLIVSILVIFTGIGLYLAPSGRIARETGWNFLGFNLTRLENLHTVAGFTMAVLIVIHFIINYKLFINEVKQVFRTKNKNTR